MIDTAIKTFGKLSKEITLNAKTEGQRLRKEIARAEGMLGNKGFVERAPAEVVESERQKLEKFRRELEALERVT